MKRSIILLFIFIISECGLKGQPLSKDTVVCIIDTTKYYVTYKVNPFAVREPKYHWQVSIKGHYYDLSKPNYKDFAGIVFDSDELSIRNIYESNFKGPFSIKVPKNVINKRFILANDEWINQQTELRILGNKIGRFPFSKCNFIVFKQDFENVRNDSVIMHRVQLGYNEVEN